jgi:hypothetical protein
MNPKSVFRLCSRSAVVVLIALLSTACIEWDRQVMTYRYDRKTDTLLIFQDYQGIYGADQEEQISDSEAKQIKSVLEGERTFFFANWILELNLDSLRDGLVDLRDRSGETVDEDVMLRHLVTVMEMVLKNSEIENGDFYLDGKERLSAVQRVRIRNVSKILPLVNVVLKAYYQSEASKTPEDMDKQTYYNAVRTGDWNFVEFNGNQIRFKFPLSDEEFAESFPQTSDSPNDLAVWKRQGVDISHKNGTVFGWIGRPTDKATRVDRDPFEKTYRDNLRQHLPGTVKVKKSLNAGKQAREFLAAR